jgi:predicted ATP-dependent endonuclease of OLD family
MSEAWDCFLSCSEYPQSPSALKFVIAQYFKVLLLEPKKLIIHCSTKAQAAQWEQLGALLKTRKSIEKMILGHLKSVEQTAINLSGELNTLYSARLEEILEMNATGKVKETA